MSSTLDNTLLVPVALAMMGLASFSLACSGTQATDDTPIPDREDGSKTSDETPTRPAWSCDTNLVPPTGWEQESAFVDKDAANARQAAADQARGKLVGRLCAGATNCDALRAEVTLWKTGFNDETVCAMAVVEAEALAQWRALQLSSANLDKQLLEAARELVGDDRRKWKMAIDKIEDAGAAGGPRARWLKGKMERALSQTNVVIVDVPKGWAGDGLPRGVDRLLRAVAVPRREGARAVVEVIWEMRFRQGGAISKKVAKPVYFPVDAAPAVTDVRPALPPSDPGLSIRLDSRAGGSLCLGETTQLWLYADQDLHVRVFDLYGKNGALLLYPNSDHPDGRIKKGETIPLGGKGGFAAVPAPDSELERFVVIAAPRREDLGRFAALSGYCRLPSDVARRLHTGAALPPRARASSDSFRLVSGGDCGGTNVDRAQAVKALTTLPECAPR